MRNLYVSTTYSPDGTPLGEVLAECAARGIDAVEIGSTHPWEADPARTVREAGLRHCVHNYFPPPRDPFVVNAASPDAAVLERSRAHIVQAIDLCAETGAELYTFHPGFLTDPAGTAVQGRNFDFAFAEGSAADDPRREEALSRFFASVEGASRHAARRGVRIAVETEGSLTSPDHLLLDRPSDCVQFLREFGAADAGISLNLGHLPLAAAARGFLPEKFVDLVAPRTVALEMSHNDGKVDQHLPLEEGAWYWNVIFDPRFDDALKILEFRNRPVDSVVRSMELFAREAARRRPDMSGRAGP